MITITSIARLWRLPCKQIPRFSVLKQQLWQVLICNNFSTSSAQRQDQNSLLDQILKPTTPPEVSVYGKYSQSVPHEDDEVVVAMSSGVDSSVCAALFASKFKNVRGIYMANWSQTAKCTERDWNDVQKVCNKIKIPCDRVNFEKEYWIDVFEPMIKMYKEGLTPNPDVSCNKFIKFGKMIEHLNKTLGPQNNVLNENVGGLNKKQKKWWLVTGHYARVMQHNQTGQHHLLRASYLPKDQSYYLSTIPSQVLPNLLLPLGHISKPEVRNLAKLFELPTSEKPDSQGLCFVSPDGNFRDFLNDYIEKSPGNVVVKETGKVVGRHDGLWQATIGQRIGLSLPQGDPFYKGVWFVSEKNYEQNEILIVKGSQNPALYVEKVFAKDWFWHTDVSSGLDEVKNKIKSGKITAQYRSLQEEIKVIDIVSVGSSEGALPSVLSIKFEAANRGIAPGQNLVLYEDSHRIIGCGTIIPKNFT